MQALVIVLSNPTMSGQVLRIMADLQVRGATVLSSTGMGRVLASTDEIPIFASLRHVLSDHSRNTTTIFAVSKHDDKIARVMDALEKAFSGFKEEDSGIMFAIPVVRAVGLAKKMSDEC